MIYTLLSETFVVRIYALFPWIFLYWKAESADVILFWMYGRQQTIICMSSENDYYRYKNINYYRCVKWKTIIGMSSENTIIGMSSERHKRLNFPKCKVLSTCTHVGQLEEERLVLLAKALLSDFSFWKERFVTFLFKRTDAAFVRWVFSPKLSSPRAQTVQLRAF